MKLSETQIDFIKTQIKSFDNFDNQDLFNESKNLDEMVDYLKLNKEIILPDSEEQKQKRLLLIALTIRAIRRLHKNGIVHGDCHLSNIMRKGKDIMFIDFSSNPDIANNFEFDFKKFEQELDKDIIFYYIIYQIIKSYTVG